MLGVLKNYFFLLRLDKPIGVYLLLWPSLTAVWLASEGKPELLIVIIFCLGSFFMRSAGVIINDYFDQDIDRKVLRTFNRPIANYSVSNKEALALFFILMILSSSLLLFLNLQLSGQPANDHFRSLQFAYGMYHYLDTRFFP
mgnify:CR=1 FL=1